MRHTGISWSYSAVFGSLVRAAKQAYRELPDEVRLLVTEDEYVDRYVTSNGKPMTWTTGRGA